jgi:thiamine transport system substrate-binding protein
MNQHRRPRHRAGAVATILLAVALLGCGSDPGDGSASTPTSGGPTSPAAPSTTVPPGTVRLVAYDSFPTKDTSLNAAIDAFSKRTGISVDLAIAGDAGTMVTKATLTAGNPEGDVMFGVDNTLLSRALAADVFTPYQPAEAAAIAPSLTSLAPGHEVTPVDFGDVCVNYDIAELEARHVAPPTTLEDLTKPAYRDMFVVEDPAASSPGLAFLLATISHFGPDGWQQYWRDLRANGVEITDSWTTAYYDDFSGAGDGKRPLVVSYGSSPPAEVIYGDPKPTEAPTGVVAATCFRQVEFVGVLRGTKHTPQAQALVDFLVSRDFQQELALNLFVYPSRSDVPLPDEFVEYAVVPKQPITMAPADIAASRETWVDQWTQLVRR